MTTINKDNFTDVLSNTSDDTPQTNNDGTVVASDGTVVTLGENPENYTKK